MKVIKLTQRYVLGKYKFTHAVRFDRECKESDAIRRALQQIHSNAYPWNIWWKYSNESAPWGYYKQPRKDRPTYWIGVKNEADLTAAILMAQL